jgi:hypothetical protein
MPLVLEEAAVPVSWEIVLMTAALVLVSVRLVWAKTWAHA